MTGVGIKNTWGHCTEAVYCCLYLRGGVPPARAARAGRKNRGRREGGRKHKEEGRR